VAVRFFYDMVSTSHSVGKQLNLWIHNLPTRSGRTMALGSTQPLTEMSTRNVPEGKGRPAHKADNLTAICEPIV
jgi:hypothetical protein